MSKIDVSKVKEERDEGYNAPNPYFENGKWYWFDETKYPSEPYNTKEEAQKDLDEYIKRLQTEMYEGEY